MDYNFKWDPRKARLNLKKHGVSFERAATVFRYPRAVSIFDGAHGGEEDRWITLGISADGGLFVVHHTFDAVDAGTVQIRIISSRRAIKKEAKQYGE